MAFCKNCGKQMNENAPYCPACGAPQTGTTRTVVYYGKKPKLVKMDTGSKLKLLGKYKVPYLIAIGTMLLSAFLTFFDAYTPAGDIGKLSDYLGYNVDCGIFGRDGGGLVFFFFLLLMGGLAIAAKPLYSRSAFNGSQYVMIMIVQGIMFAMIMMFKEDMRGYEFNFVGSLLTILLVGGFILEIVMIVLYGKLKRMNVYQHVMQ